MITLGGKTPETIFIASKEVAAISINNDQVWVKTQPTPPTPTVDYLYIQNTYAGQNTITVTTTYNGSPAANTHATSVEYSKDLTNWTTMTFVTGYANAQTITMDEGETVYFRNSSGKFSYDSILDSYKTSFTNSQSCIVGGDVRTLLDYTDYEEVTVPQGAFYGLFSENLKITDASRIKLPDEIPAYGCKYMFHANYNMTVPPEIPATEVGEYGCQNMFSRCAHLTTAPVLKSQTLTMGCYEQMFYDCSLLNSVTIEANNISASGCLTGWLSGVAQTGTFYNNGSATYTTNSANGIPTGWTEVKPTPPTPTVDYFYIENEYAGSNKITITTEKYDAHEEEPDADPLDMTKCGTSIEWSKDLTNWTTETLSDQTPVEINMSQGEKVYFRNDTGKFNYFDKDWYSEWSSSINCTRSFSVGGDIYTLIDYTGTNIGNRYDGCLHSLFASSQLLVDVTDLDFTQNSLVPYEFRNTFFDTRFTTPPTLPATTLAQNCYNNMFASSAITSAPSLPATTLSDYCYEYMFNFCSSLTTTTLPATTLAEGCYFGMFAGASGLNSVTTYANDISAMDCLLDWLDGVASTGTFHNLGSAVYPTDSTSGIPTGWTEVNS